MKKQVELVGGPLDGTDVVIPLDTLIYQSNRARGGAYVVDRKRSPSGARLYWAPDDLKDRTGE